MLIKLVAAAGSYVVGYLWFWLAAIGLKSRNRLGPNFITGKYLGFASYRDLRSHVIGATALWAPFVGVISVYLCVVIGWPDVIWIVAFPVGYAVAFYRFLKKPRQAWEHSGPHA